MTGFFAEVYAVVARIPVGKVMTYGQVARRMGKPDSARQVGWALHANRDTKRVPCHRVVNRHGKTASGYAGGGAAAQQRKLEAEGVRFSRDGKIDLKKYLWKI